VAETEDEMQRRATWQRVVTHKTPQVSTLSSMAASSAVSDGLPDTPAPPLTTSMPSTPVPGMPFMGPRASNNKPPRFSFMTRVSGWVAILVILALLLGGAFGIFVSLGRNPQPAPSTGALTLRATPPTIAIGGVLILRGSHFTPRARVGLTRDNTIHIIDIGGQSFISADANGSFSDSVNIGSSWTTGQHTIRAEDAFLHKTATISIQVTGHSSLSQFPHFTISVNSIDFGSGDQATNSSQVITLANAGGGEIDWQSTSTQPWLLISPQSGTISGGVPMQVTVAIDRSSLRIGSYTAEVFFTSVVGKIALPIKMQVSKLQPGHEAIMQLTPAVLSYSGVDGSASLASQVVTVSNPGVLSLQWSAASVTSDGSNWLSASPQSGTVTKGTGQPVTISINSSLLLPGVYYGSVTFSSKQGAGVINSTQTVYVSVTIVPQCSIQVSPGALSFTAVYLQPAPAAKSISVGVNQGCSTPLNWTAAVSGGSWLSISATVGATPAAPRVAINDTGLKAGTYSGALIFTTAAGTQTLPVLLIVGQPTTPIMTSAPALLTFNAITGQATPPPVQTITLSNTGGGTLSWSAAALTAVGGTWLTATPTSGVLLSHQTATVTVTVALLTTLVSGTYTGSVTITGKGSNGLAAAGSPQTLPVTFIVQAPCTIASSLPALTFQSVIGQPAPVAQPLTISASGACANALNWTATAATVPVGGTWLTLTPATGVVSTKVTSLTSVGIATGGLVAGSYTGTITISAIDSVTHAPLRTPQNVTVTLTVQPACTLQAPSVAAETFSGETGLNPATQTFTVGVIGGCTGNVTITPTATMTNGSGWLAVSPASASIAANGTATFTVTVASSALASGNYAGTISLAGVNSAGITITGSPQAVSVNLSSLAAPVLNAGPTSLTFNVTTGANSQTIALNNAGGEPLNWSAALAATAPAYVTISSANSGNLAAGANTTITVSVNATGLAGGTTVSTSVTISATDPLTGKAVSGSPSNIPISINVVPPAMQLSATALVFTAPAGTNPAAQTLTITNTGGNSLTWTAGTPSQTWLIVSPATGTDVAGGTSTVTFNVNVTGLTAGPYTATVAFTAPGGISQTVTVTLTIT